MENEVKIFVCERGWVLVGRPKPSRDALVVILDDCCTVRRWGTTKGLGELAANGPLRETVLDYEGDGVELNRLIIYRAIPCSEEAWRSWKPYHGSETAGKVKSTATSSKNRERVLT
jgi:hypothetical protein